MKWFVGNRTYITLGIAAAAYAAFLAGLITQQQLTTILEGLGIPAVAFLRSAMTRQSDAVIEKVEEVKQDVHDVKQDVKEAAATVDEATPRFR